MFVLNHAIRSNNVIKRCHDLLIEYKSKPKDNDEIDRIISTLRHDPLETIFWLEYIPDYPNFPFEKVKWWIDKGYITFDLTDSTGINWIERCICNNKLYRSSRYALVSQIQANEIALTDKFSNGKEVMEYISEDHQSIYNLTDGYKCDTSKYITPTKFPDLLYTIMDSKKYSWYTPRIILELLEIGFTLPDKNKKGQMYKYLLKNKKIGGKNNNYTLEVLAIYKALSSGISVADVWKNSDYWKC